MMFDAFSRLIKPRFPSAAVCLESDFASVASLDRRRGALTLEAAAQIPLPEGLIVAAFDQTNIRNQNELTDLLANLILNAGLGRRQRWSAALPELSARTILVVLENKPSSSAEKEEMINWKIERSFGVPAAELRVTRQALTPDERGRARFLASAVRLDVLAEYEAVFAALGWQAGLILPRHLGEVRWLAAASGSNDAKTGDGLLISSHREGFTAIILREREPLIIRQIHCERADCTDELYRLLLFYKERGTASTTNGDSETTIERVLVVGDTLEGREVSDCVSETLATRPRLLNAQAIGLMLPSDDLSFETLAAPAGLATMKWE